MPKNDTSQNGQTDDLRFRQRVWIAASIFAFVTLILLFLKATFNVFLLILAGCLVAVFFKSISSYIQQKTKWNVRLCDAISFTATLLVVVALSWLIGAKVQEQIAELQETLPKTISNVKAHLNNTSIGQKVIDESSSDKTLANARQFVSGFFASTFGVLGDLYAVFFIGIFFTIAPKTYTDGFVKLMPIGTQEKTKEILGILGKQLRKWLKGKLFSMLIVFILTAIGLASLGVPLWLVLSLFAGLISFIPNFGPLLSVIPAMLIASTQSLELALWVAGLYIVIQFIESNFVTPFIQQKLVNMPPALILIAQLLMGALSGGWGLLLATPLTLITIVVVDELYIKPRKDD